MYLFPYILGRDICDSDNKNGHAWLCTTRLKGMYMYGGVFKIYIKSGIYISEKY